MAHGGTNSESFGECQQKLRELIAARDGVVT